MAVQMSDSVGVELSTGSINYWILQYIHINIYDFHKANSSYLVNELGMCLKSICKCHIFITKPNYINVYKIS